MDRGIVYPGSIPLDSDILGANQRALIGIGALAKMALGQTTVVDGLIGTQTTTASLTINIGPGSIISLQEVDANAYGSLGTNTNPLVKMGINLTSTPFTLTAPGTSGQSINYLIEAQFFEQDGTPVVLPYVNPSNPSSPYSGPANAGTAQNTVRAETVSLQLKAGAAATTGTQTTPATDTGWVPLYVITVNYGQTTITTAQITQVPGAPFIDPLAVGRGIQPGRLINVQRFTVAGTYTYTPTIGTNSIIVEVVGGGAAGGGGAATGSGQVSVAGGGGAGGAAKSRLLSGFSGISVTVGAGGTPISGGAGGNGSSSSFGSFLSATGGLGASVAVASSAYPYFSGYGAPGVGSNGNIFNSNGGNGQTSFATGAATVISGTGGFSMLGGGGQALTSFGPGAASPSYGGGGGGGGVGSAQSAQPGGSGGVGAVIVWEFS